MSTLFGLKNAEGHRERQPFVLYFLWQSHFCHWLTESFDFYSVKALKASTPLMCHKLISFSWGPIASKPCMKWSGFTYFNVNFGSFSLHKFQSSLLSNTDHFLYTYIKILLFARKPVDTLVILLLSNSHLPPTPLKRKKNNKFKGCIASWSAER